MDRYEHCYKPFSRLYMHSVCLVSNFTSSSSIVCDQRFSRRHKDHLVDLSLLKQRVKGFLYAPALSFQRAKWLISTLRVLAFYIQAQFTFQLFIEEPETILI